MSVVKAWNFDRQYAYKEYNSKFRKHMEYELLTKHGQKPAFETSIIYSSPPSGRDRIITKALRRRCHLCETETNKRCPDCCLAHDK